jgi:hypothetical protein
MMGESLQHFFVLELIDLPLCKSFARPGVNYQAEQLRHVSAYSTAEQLW